MRKVVYFFVVLAALTGFAQTDTTSNAQGEVLSGEIVIEKNKQIILPTANRIFQKGTLKEYDAQPLNIKLFSPEPKLEWPPSKSIVPYQKVQSEYPIVEYPNYVRLGYGNYNSPLAEVGVFEQLGAFDIDSKVFYERFATGPVNGSNSGNALGSIDLSGTYKTDQFSVTPYLDFSQNTYRFYGNSDRTNPGFSTESLLKVRWSNFNFGTHVSGNTGNIRYSLTPSLQNSSQKPSGQDPANKESLFIAKGSFDYKIDEKISSGFEIEGYTGSYEGGISYDRSLFQAKPWLRYKAERFTLDAGFKLASGKSSGQSETGFYPSIEGVFGLDQDWKLFGYAKGGVAFMDLQTVLLENEFMDDSLQILNQENRLILGGGLSGSLLNNLNLEIDLSFADISNLPFYLPSASDSSRFALAYDTESVQRFRLNSVLTYAPTNTSLYGAELTFDSYSVANFDRPWHLPAYTLKVFTSHNIKQKVVFSGSLLAIGGIRAPTTIDFGIENLKTIFDLSFKADYAINERASIFLDTQNLLNQEYERYIGYPVRGATFKIGGQYRF